MSQSTVLTHSLSFYSYCQDLSTAGLQDIVLSRLNRLSNLRKEMRELRAAAANQQAELQVAEFFLPQRREARPMKRQPHAVKLPRRQAKAS